MFNTLQKCNPIHLDMRKVCMQNILISIKTKYFNTMKVLRHGTPVLLSGMGALIPTLARIENLESSFVKTFLKQQEPN